MATKNLNQIKAELQQFYGSEQFYKGFNPNSIYTEGFKHFITEAECYWFYDIIQTQIFDTLKKHHVLDTFYLTLDVKNDKCDIILKDWQKVILFKRHISYTDAPSGEITFVSGWDGQTVITCLQSEN